MTLASHSSTLPAGVMVFRPGEGRPYDCGPMHSVFLADGEETGDRYSVSLWWVAPVTHDFENRTTEPAGAFNVFIPGGFESHMPEIVEWFKPD